MYVEMKVERKKTLWSTVTAKNAMLAFIKVSLTDGIKFKIDFSISACYGIVSVPNDDWFCRPCEAKETNLVCHKSVNQSSRFNFNDFSEM